MKLKWLEVEKGVFMLETPLRPLLTFSPLQRGDSRMWLINGAWSVPHSGVSMHRASPSMRGVRHHPVSPLFSSRGLDTSPCPFYLNLH